MTRLWDALFGPSPRAGRDESLDKIRGLMREREQIDQSSERWRLQMQEAVQAFGTLADEGLAARGSLDARDPE